MLDASTPPSPIDLSSLHHSVVSSKLVNSQRDISEQIRQIDSFPPLSHPLPFFLLFTFSSVGLHFCVPLALKREVKWPWIGQEVGVSSWCRFQETCRLRRKKGDVEKRARRGLCRSPPRHYFSQPGSLRVCSLQIRLFFTRSLSSLQPLFLRPHLPAGVINDLTDTLDERCRESVKQVVIKTDAVSLWRGGERRQRKKESERERRETNGIDLEEREKGRVKFIIYPRIRIPLRVFYIQGIRL